MKDIILIKYGGNAISDKTAVFDFAKTISLLKNNRQNCKIVVVHGGGPQISYWLEKTNCPSHFVDGMRYTNNEALEIVEMALCANVNKSIVRALQSENISAVGISGEDANILSAKQNHSLGEVGDISNVDPNLILCLLNNDFLPVIAPLACTNNFSKALNINADFCASEIAGKLSAKECVFISNVDGVLDANKKLISQISVQEIMKMIDDGIITGGMIPKVQCAIVALEKGVQQVRIINGTNDNFKNFANNQLCGTLIHA